MEITLSVAAFVTKNKSAAMLAEARAGHGPFVKSQICQTCPCLKDLFIFFCACEKASTELKVQD